jgi:hypothetical protein
MKTSARRIAVLAAIALTTTGVGAVPATVAQTAGTRASTIQTESGSVRSEGRRTVRVAGRQIPVDLDNGLYEMRGSLVGDWQYIPREVLHDQPTLYAEAGVEVFTGCIDRRPRDGRCTRRDRRGELHLAFLYWASFDANGDLIRGQCVHPVTGGRGAFAGARGRLDMVDTPVGDEVRTTYRGRITLNAVPAEGDAETPLPSSEAATTATQKTSAHTDRRAC